MVPCFYLLLRRVPLDAVRVKGARSFRRLHTSFEAATNDIEDDKNPIGDVGGGSVQILDEEVAGRGATQGTRRERLFWDGCGWIPWRIFCRGGGGGGGGNGLAAKLQALLDEVEPPESKAQHAEARLLTALRKLVERASPSQIAERLRTLLAAHDDGSGGRALGEGQGDWPADLLRQGP